MTFTNTGCSAIISPYMNSKGQIIGAVGVIGPLILIMQR